MKRKFWTRAISLGLAAIIILIAGGIVYLYRMQRSMWKQSVESVLEVTTQGGKAFEVYMNQGFFMLEGRAAIFAQYSSKDVDIIGTKLDIYEDGDISFGAIDLNKGILYLNNRENIKLSKEKVDLYLSLSKNGFLEPFICEYTGRRVVGYYERFTFSDGTPGMVRKTVPVAEVAERFSLSFYDGAGFSYIVNRDGEIMLRSAGENGNRTLSNIFDVVELDDKNEYNSDELREGMLSGKSGVVKLLFDGEEHIFAFVPIASTDDWYLISIIPDDTIMENANKILMSSQLYVGVLGLSALIFFSFVLVLVQHSRQVQEKETEVLYREQLFDLLANNTNDVFIIISTDGKTVLYISPNVEWVVGISPDEAKKDARKLQELIHNGGQGVSMEDILSTPLDGTLSFDASCIHPKTGDRRWFTETVYHTTQGSRERYIIALIDRTADRKKEATLTEALQIAKVANESKSAFLSNMSHDIRTPMNAIVGLSTLLQRDAEDPEAVRLHTRKITASSQHLLSLINDVLDMSKIESGKTSLNISDFNLAELVSELGAIIRPQTKAKKQTFDISVQDINDEYLTGDKLRINQVMINILSNAVKYTPEGGRIMMTVRQLGQPTQNIARIRFTVEDNGIGISEEYQRDIFSPFTREIRTVVNRIQGTGLGMAITKNLVDLMGGTISVKSKIGEGSTFTIDLDLSIQNREDDSDFWEEHGIHHALVVDDEVDICTGILTAMAGTGVSMEFALNGQTAVSMTETACRESNDFDLILLDWKMPGMDGLETARMLRARIPKHIPIMILTAYDLDDIREEGLSAGIDGFLAKPFFISNLKEVIRNISLHKHLLIPQKTEKPDIKGRLFLCAEDNELNAEILEELLHMEGAQCEIAVDGKEALEAFEKAPEGKYDAILMDIQMPVMNGYEATEAIRASNHPQAKTIPIVAMTANAFADDVRNSLDSGMNAHIAKPLDMDKLATILDEIWNSQT